MAFCVSCLGVVCVIKKDSGNKNQYKKCVSEIHIKGFENIFSDENPRQIWAGAVLLDVLEKNLWFFRNYVPFCVIMEKVKGGLIYV